jgi:drug/metabolite transporter (DMT)-like permease
MSSSLPGYLAALLALSAAGTRTVIAWKTPPQTARQLLTAAIAAFGLSLALSAPATLAAANDFDPFPNATRLVGNLLWMVSAFFLASMLAYANENGRAARRVRNYSAILVIAGCAMAALLLGAHTHTQPPRSHLRTDASLSSRLI